VGAGSGLSFYPNIFCFGSDFLSTRPEPDPLPSLRTAHERKMKASGGELHASTEKRGYSDPKRNQNQKRGTIT
jgi:hypothetical protein